MSHHRNWADLTTDAIAALPRERCVAILPVGAVEQHGPHLPLGTDTIIAEGIVAAALDRLGDDLPVVVLPTQAIGASSEHGDFHGTLSHEAETLIAAWSEIGATLCRNGIMRLVIFNAHGGQPQIVDIVAQRLRSRNGMLVVRGNYMTWPLPHGLVDADEVAHGHHGGMLETAIMLALRPDLVAMEHACSFDSSARQLAGRHTRFGHDGRLGFAWQAQDLNPAGVVGDAAAATAELGRQLIGHHAARLAELIGDAAAFDMASLRKGPLQP